MVIRFETNIPVEIALKYDDGKEVPSRIPDAPNQVMYTVCGGDTIYVPLHVAGMIQQKGIKREELMSICKRQSGKSVKWTVDRISDAVEPARSNIDRALDAAVVPAVRQLAADCPPISFDELPTALETQLVRSIDQAKQQKARRDSSSQDQPAAPPLAASNQQTPNVTVLTTAGQTGLSMLLGGCMVAAIDAAVVARDYAHTKNLTLQLSEESIQDLATSLLIHVQRMAELECKYDIKAAQAANRMAQSGGVKWQR